jgi:SAM-dependent methyltransferase
MQTPTPAVTGHYSHESALFVLIEDFAEQRKVLAVTSSVLTAKRLAEVAEEVQVLYPGKIDELGPVEHVQVKELRPGQLPFPDGYFDLAVVPELLQLGEQGERHIAELRRVLREDGILVASMANAGAVSEQGGDSTKSAPQGLAYDDFVDSLKRHFETVRMIGELPFYGYSLIDLSVHAPLSEISFDGTLLDTEEQPPERFVALCSNDELPVDAMTVIQVPRLEIAGAAESAADETEQAESEVAKLERSLNERSAEIRSLRTELERRGALVRDLIEQTRKRAAEQATVAAVEPGEQTSQPAEPQGNAPAEAAEIVKLRSERDAAVARALDAEVARVEAQLQLDELSGYVAATGVKTDAAQDGAEPSSEVKTSELQAMVAQLEADKKALQTEIATAEARLREKDELLAANQQRVRDMENRLKLSEQRLETVESLEAVTEELNNTRSEISDLKSAESALRMRLSNAESSLDRETQKTEEIAAKKAETEAELAKLARDFSERQQASLMLERSMASLTAELERLQHQLELSRTVEARAMAAENRAEQLEGALDETLESLSSLAKAVTEEGSSTSYQQKTQVILEEGDPARKP